MLTEGKKDRNTFKAIFIIGSPGAGKTEVYRETLRGKGLKHLDPDKVMGFFVRKDRGSLKDTNNYSKYQQKIQKTLKSATDAYLLGRLGLAIDGTGRDKKLISDLKSMLENLGYSTAMIYVNTPITQAMRRIKNRERAVDKDYMLKARKAVKQNVPEYKSMFSNFFEVNDESQISNVEKQINKFLSSPVSAKANKWLNEEMILQDFVNELTRKHIR